MDADTIKMVGAGVGGGLLTFLIMASFAWKYIKGAVADARKSTAAADEVVAKAAETPIDQWREIVTHQNRKIGSLEKRLQDTEQRDMQCQSEMRVVKAQNMSQQRQMDWTDRVNDTLIKNITRLVDVLKEKGVADTALNLLPLPTKPPSNSRADPAEKTPSPPPK